jgi:phage/plasmid-like protein (TIGR03299 family)
METTNFTQAKAQEVIVDKSAIYNKTFDLLTDTKTNWGVTKKPLTCPDGYPTESFGIYRNDNNKWLGTVGKQYELMHNSTLAENIIEASMDISEKFRGGELYGGKKVYYQAQLEDTHIANDTIKRYVTGLNSHDGSTSIGFGFTNQVVVCQNTFHIAMKEVNRFRHTTSAQQRVELARIEINRMLKIESGLMENYKRMADAKINTQVTKRVIADLFGFNEEDFDKEEKDFSTKKVNDLKKFNDILESELNSHGRTLWGLFNAVTWKTNHQDVKEGRSLENVMVGSGYKKNLNAYNIIVDSLPVTVGMV